MNHQRAGFPRFSLTNPATSAKPGSGRLCPYRSSYARYLGANRWLVRRRRAVDAAVELPAKFSTVCRVAHIDYVEVRVGTLPWGGTHLLHMRIADTAGTRRTAQRTCVTGSQHARSCTFSGTMESFEHRKIIN